MASLAINLMIWMPILCSAFIFSSVMKPTVIMTLATTPLLFLYISCVRNQKKVTFFIKICMILIASVIYAFLFDIRGALYLLFDISAMLIAIEFIRSSKEINKTQLYKYVAICSILYIVLFMALLSSSSIWFLERYTGPLANVNLSLYFLGCAVIFLCLYLPSQTNMKSFIIYLSLAIVFLLIGYIATASRSIIFLLIPLFAFIMHKINRHSKIAVTILLLLLVAPIYWLSVNSNNSSIDLSRFNSEETSYQTRSLISLDLFIKMLDNKGVPAGPHQAVDYVVQEYGNPEMHPHNDFLAGIIDYGLLYVILVFLFIYNWFRFFGWSLFSISVIILLFSSALHGYFNGLILLPISVAIISYYNSKYLSVRK